MWTVEDAWKRIKMKRWLEVSLEISQTRAFVVYTKTSSYVSVRHNVQFYCLWTFYGVDSPKRIKTVVWTRIDRCVSDDNEHVYFWKRRIMVYKA